MLKKLLFIVPQTLDMGEVAKKMRVQNATIPYGVLSMATYVKANAQVDIKIFDMNVAPYAEMNAEDAYSAVAEAAAQFSPDVIGISLMYNHMYSHIVPLSKALKQKLPSETILVAGGCCVMAYLENILKDCPFLDAICFAEGEIPMLDLINADNRHQLLEQNPAWITMNSTKNGKQPSPRFVENLDDIPAIDFGLVNLSLYGAHRSSFRPVKKEKEFCLPITTTRGCPYNCVFCIAGALHGKRIRKMSAARVLADVREMIDKYGINVLSIEDDQFLSDLQRSKEMLRGLKEFNLSLIADSGFTVKLLDEEVCMLLAEAGLQTAVLAIESGSEFVLKEIIDKPIKLEQIPPAVKSIRKAGMYCHAFLVTGFPGETDEHRRQTVEFIKSVGIDWCYITCATPIRGSRLYEQCIENNYIDNSSHTENAFYVSCINTPDYSADYISKAAYLMNLELNFVCNHRLCSKDFKTLAIYMEHVLSKYPEHAFANYYAAIAYTELRDEKKSAEYRKRYDRIVTDSKEWADYARHFHLPTNSIA